MTVRCFLRYVLAGGGLYSFAIERTPVRRRGLALTGGIEIPVGGRGAVQLDAQVHMISLSGHPLVSAGAMALNISIEWSHRKPPGCSASHARSLPETPLPGLQQAS